LLLIFEDYSVDRHRRELRRGGSLQRVEPQVFDLLLFLIDNRERVVSKDDLLASVWGGRTVSESTLASRINAARRAVGDTGEQQRLIRTIHGRGFRFVGTIRETEERAASVDGIAVAPSAQAELSVSDRPSGLVTDTLDRAVAGAHRSRLCHFTRVRKLPNASRTA
jgi:DNA-binding winged helix-turn-helix (wHTH) protein